MSGILEIKQAVKDLSPGELNAFRDWFFRFDEQAGRLVALEVEGVEALLNQREAELDADPALELSEEAFMSHFNMLRVS